MKISPDLLKPHPLLALLPYRKLKELVAGSAVSEYSKGDVIFREGERCDAIYLIVSGRCEGRASGAHGAVHEVYGPGDTLGDRAFLNDEPHRSTVSVATRCVLLRIPARDLEGLFTKDPTIAGRFSQAVTRGAGSARERHPEFRARRVVSLVSLAPRLDASSVANRLSAALHKLTNQQVLLVNLVRNGESARPHDWVLREPAFNGSFSFGRQLSAHAAGFDELRLPVGREPRYSAAIAPLIGHCSRHYDYVILNVDPRLPAETLGECVIQADLAYTLLQPSVQNLADFEALLADLRARSSGTVNHVLPIIFVEEPFDANEFHEVFAKFRRPVHSFARGFPSDGCSPDHRFGLHINRIAREIARRRIGLALSSGAAKGLAHVGVIQVLEENGIEIDAIAGTSMGAYVGALWAYGLDGAALERIARELEGRWGLLKILQPILPPRLGILSTRRVAHRLRRSLGEAHFSDMVRPLRVVATHRDTMESVVFSTGNVVSAVEASIAMPGICVPVTIEGETYLDGGISDPLPTDVLAEMGIERIIAVNVMPTPQMLRYWQERPGAAPAEARPSWSVTRLLSQHLNYFAAGNVFDTIMQAVNSIQNRVAEANSAQAQVVLRPVSPDARWHDFNHPGKYIALGRAAAEAQLPEIVALAKQNPVDEIPKLPPKLASAAALAAA